MGTGSDRRPAGLLTFHRLADADELLQEIGAGADATPGERNRERSVVGDHAEIAAEGEVEASAVSMAIDHRYHGFGHSAHPRDDQGPAAFALDILLDGVVEAADGCAGFVHAAQIVAGTERAAGAGEDRDADLGVAIGVIERLQ
jgi:hypothetical protein